MTLLIMLLDIPRFQGDVDLDARRKGIEALGHLEQRGYVKSHNDDPHMYSLTKKGTEHVSSL
jgi:predicted transcriptional regulator